MSNSQFKKGMMQNRIYAEISKVVVKKDKKGKIIERKELYDLYTVIK